MNLHNSHELYPEQNHYSSGKLFNALWEILFLIKEIDLNNTYRGTPLTEEEGVIIHQLKQDVEAILASNKLNFA